MDSVFNSVTVGIAPQMNIHTNYVYFNSLFFAHDEFPGFFLSSLAVDELLEDDEDDSLGLGLGEKVYTGVRLSGEIVYYCVQSKLVCA